MQAACEVQELVTKRDLVESGLDINQAVLLEGGARSWGCEKHSEVRAPKQQAESEVDCEVTSPSEASRNPAGLGTPDRVI